jgi:hypothetical protein
MAQAQVYSNSNANILQFLEHVPNSSPGMLYHVVYKQERAPFDHWRV